VLYSGIGITAIGVFLMNYGAAKIPMATAATLSTLMPASTCLLAIFFLNETLRGAQIIGLGLILGGALLTVGMQRHSAPIIPRAADGG
jgi:drug/metabolite transporter (DMT)-like permease